MAAYYNEIDDFSCAWLRELIRRGLIADGVVDNRSIVDVRAEDLREFTQCNFFAGIGVWSYALRLAGWSDSRPVWTGSCPCQPFSTAGKQRGSEDERHLWPAFFRLISECRPSTVIGEQVAGAAGLAWLDHVCADLEDSDYAVAAANIGAHSVGAPHLRQRLYWVADAERGNAERQRFDMGTAQGSGEAEAWQRERIRVDAGAGFDAGIVADSGSRERGQGISAPKHAEISTSVRSVVGDVLRKGLERHRSGLAPEGGRDAKALPVSEAGQPSFWSDAEWIWCRDGKWRPAKPGIFPLVDGSSRGLVRGCDHGEAINANATGEARVQRLRGYGNAIVAPLAAEFIKAYMECRQ